MFNLEQAIIDWRQQMLAAGIQSPVPLEELESHLREDIERKLRAGVTAPQAFETASRTIGQPNMLRAEFARSGLTSMEQERKWLRRFCVVFPVVYLVLTVSLLSRIEMDFPLRLLGLGAIVLSVLFMAGCPLMHHLVPVIRHQPTRVAIQIAGTLIWPLLGLVVLNVVLPHYDLTFEQLIVGLLWSIAALTFFTGISIGLGDAADRQRGVADK
jgi:hypothetical protein